MNNPPAFPRAGYTDTSSGTLPDGDEVISHNDGMTLRDYFAAKAMQALSHFTANGAWSSGDVSAHAYDLADAMLKARKQ